MTEVNTEFKNTIKNFVGIDDQIRTLQNQIKELKRQKTQFSKNIVTYMSQNNLENTNINISDGKLKVVQSKRQVAVNKPYAIKVLTEYFQDSEEATKVASLIFDNREFKFTKNLKRTVNKKSKNEE